MGKELTWLEKESLKIIGQKELGEFLDTGEFEYNTEKGIFNLLEIQGVDVLKIESTLDALKDAEYIDDTFTITDKGERYLEIGEQEKMGTVINFNGNVEQVNTGDNNSIEKKGVFVSVEGNSITPSSSGIGTKLVEGAVEVVKDKFLGNK